MLLSTKLVLFFSQLYEIRVGASLSANRKYKKTFNFWWHCF